MKGCVSGLADMERKRWVSLVSIILFVVFSFLFISPSNRRGWTGNHSSVLEKTIVRDGNTEKTEFRDETGKITNAADQGYAICIAETTGSIRIEKFYDDQGEPVKRYPGYYGLMREYDEMGNMTRCTYLDRNGAPSTNDRGYAVEEREFNEYGQVTAIRYFDTAGNPVFTKLYGCGRINEYDENGYNFRITYIDAAGNPTITGLGYASILRRFYGNDSPQRGKVESEFYFDDHGNPIALFLGEYGVHKEYDKNGQVSVLTCLGSNGEPIITNKGYTTILYTYHADNSTATERYYDIDGNPFSLPDGQYGIRKQDGQTIYLDENGSEIFSIRRLLYNHSWAVIPLALSVIILSTLGGKRQNTVFLIFCIAAIAYMTLLFRGGESAGYSGLLWYYRRMLFDSSARADIIKNIWLFIPLGAVLYRLYPKTAILLVPIALSVLVEGIQLFARIGTCELDDIISNGVGGWIGYCMERLATDIKLIINHRKQHTV